MEINGQYESYNKFMLFEKNKTFKSQKQILTKNRE